MKNHQLIERLVRQAQAGSHEAFNRLVETFREMAFYEAFRWLGDSHSAEDAAQDAFLAAYTHLDQLRSPQNFGAWFRQIVRSQCNLQTRRKRPKLEPLDEKPHLSAPTPTPEHIIETREDQQSVRDAIANLPEHERVVTEEFYLKGQKQADIAEKLGIPLTTVKKRLQYARKKLKGMIEQLIIDPDLIPSWKELKRLFDWIPRLWRRIQHYGRKTQQFFDILFSVNYSNTLAYRQSNDQPSHRDLDL